MRLFTCYAMTDGIKKWLAIDELPAMQGMFVNEVYRIKLTRQGLLVTTIVLDSRISRKEAIELTNYCFDNQQDWLTVQFEKSAYNAELAKKAARRG